MSTATRLSVILVGCASTLTGLLGLCYNGITLFSALQGAFSGSVADQGLKYFYPAFYAMSAVCITCHMLLVVFGIDLLRQRFRFSWFLTGVLVFEIVYFVSLGPLWLVPGVGMSIAAATGVANGGLMAQFVILFPLWAPPLLWWARRKSAQDTPAA
jgi:hypothetical protein